MRFFHEKCYDKPFVNKSKWKIKEIPLEERNFKI